MAKLAQILLRSAHSLLQRQDQTDGTTRSQTNLYVGSPSYPRINWSPALRIGKSVASITIWKRDLRCLPKSPVAATRMRSLTVTGRSQIRTFATEWCTLPITSIRKRRSHSCKRLSPRSRVTRTRFTGLRVIWRSDAILPATKWLSERQAGAGASYSQAPSGLSEMPIQTCNSVPDREFVAGRVPEYCRRRRVQLGKTLSNQPAKFL